MSDKYKSAGGRGLLTLNERHGLTNEMEQYCTKENEYLGWDKLVEKLMKEGHSKESAEKIAGYIKEKKYG